jgi:hypothetical protein
MKKFLSAIILATVGLCIASIAATAPSDSHTEKQIKSLGYDMKDRVRLIQQENLSWALVFNTNTFGETGPLKADPWTEKKGAMPATGWVVAGTFKRGRVKGFPRLSDFGRVYEALQDKESNETFLINPKILTSTAKKIVNGVRNSFAKKGDLKKIPGKVNVIYNPAPDAGSYGYNFHSQSIMKVLTTRDIVKYRYSELMSSFRKVTESHGSVNDDVIRTIIDVQEHSRSRP